MLDNLNLYHVFYVVAKTLNITTAAKELYISQPAVSKSISRLEDFLGISLFIRSSKGVALTYEGELLFQKLEVAFRSIEQGETQIKNITRLSVGHIRIGASTTLCKFVLLPYLKKFKEAFPHINISITCQSSNETLKALEKGQVDVGLVGEVADAHYEFHPLQEIKDSFVTTRSYIKSLVEIYGEDADLEKNATFLLLDKANLSRQYIDHYMLQKNISMQNVMEVSTMDLLIDFVKTDLGIACVIESFVEEELNEGVLIRFKEEFTFPPRRIGFVYAKGMIQTKALTSFLDFFFSEKKGL